MLKDEFYLLGRLLLLVNLLLKSTSDIVNRETRAESLNQIKMCSSSGEVGFIFAFACDRVCRNTGIDIAAWQQFPTKVLARIHRVLSSRVIPSPEMLHDQQTHVLIDSQAKTTVKSRSSFFSYVPPVYPSVCVCVCPSEHARFLIGQITFPRPSF